MPKKHSLVPLTSIWVGLFFLVSACNFALASDAGLTSRLVPTAVAGQPAATAPTPDISATVEYRVQQRLSELLASDSPASGESGQFPTLSPGNTFTGERFISGFACTGSMRPTIDCGDEGVFLRPPFPGPLAVGDIISFSTDVSCRYYKNQNISKAHRIISIRTENGVTYYTTQGDAANSPDPCETTIDQIDGKLLEIRKGVRPQDIIDTSEYDQAKERVTLLKEQYEVKRTQFDQDKAAYDTRGKEYQALVTSYTNGQTEYEVVVNFYQQLEAERTALNLQKDQLNDLAEQINTGIEKIDRLYQELFIK